MKKILITGSSGYIATNFMSLYKDEYDFIKIDRKSGKEVSDIEVYQYQIMGNDIDHIVHLAAISGIQACEDNKKQTIQDNIMTINKISNISKRCGIPVTFASSQAAKDGFNTYSFTKMIGEEILLSSIYNACILRFSNIYGGLNYLETKTSVVSKYINAVRNDEPIYVNGDGLQTRDFLHVDDACKAIHLSIQLEKKNNIILDIGTGIETNILDLARMISPESILYKKKNGQIGINSNVADTTVAEEVLGFKATKILQNYIKDMRLND